MANINFQIQNNSGMTIIRNTQQKPNYEIVNNNKSMDPGKRFNKNRGKSVGITNGCVANIISDQLRKKKR